MRLGSGVAEAPPSGGLPKAGSGALEARTAFCAIVHGKDTRIVDPDSEQRQRF